LLNEVYQDVKLGLVGGVLLVDVSRLSRDEDLIDPTVFARACKKSDTAIITSADSYIYDFNHPTRDDLKRFTDEAYVAAQFIKRQIRGKMLKARDTKASNGKLGNGQAPVGLMLNDERDGLISSPHHECVDWLYARFRSLNASLSSLLRELVNMTRQGIALFPYDERIDPSTIHLDLLDPNDDKSGWIIKSRHGLEYILTNPQYLGHLVWTQPGKSSIVKRNAHQAIVNEENWHYAFEHLSDVDLDGNVIEHDRKTVRYTQRASVDSGALLTGTRDSGKLVIDGVNNAHVYHNVANKCYILRDLSVTDVYGFETSITTRELDDIVEARLLHWLGIADKRGSDWLSIQERVVDDKWLVSSPVIGGESPIVAMDSIKQREQPKSTLADLLEETVQKLASVQRALRFQDSMSDERLEETLKKESRLIRRRGELAQAIQQEQVLAKKREQARDDIDTAYAKWSKWTIEEKRSFIRLVTDYITLEEIASGWLRLTVGWSSLMGFISSDTRTLQAVDIGYVWRQSGTLWTEIEENTIRELYPHAARTEILHTLPNRSWSSIRARARRLDASLHRYNLSKEQTGIPDDMSLSDIAILNEFMLEPERVQWQHTHLTNDDFIS
jgi:hypothetical protein